MKKRSPSATSGKAQSAVKREQENATLGLRAGLLWRLLPAKSRTLISAYLSAKELASLNKAYSRYASSQKDERIVVENRVQTGSRLRWGGTPLIIFALGLGLFTGLLVFHRFAFPRVNLGTALQIMSPLLIGVFSAPALYILPVYRARILFRFPRTPQDAAFSIVSCIALVWVLSFIGMDQARSPSTLPDRFSFSVLLFGAALAPLLEEIFFREVIPAAMGRDPYYFGHVLSAAIFTLAHIPSTWSMALLYFVAALILSAVRIETGTLTAGVAAHSTANVLVLIL